MRTKGPALALGSLFLWVGCCPQGNWNIQYTPSEPWSYALPITVQGPYASQTKALSVSMMTPDGQHADGFLIWGDARGDAYRPFTFHSTVAVDYQPAGGGEQVLSIQIKGPHAPQTKALTVGMVDSAGHSTDGLVVWGDGRSEAFKPFTFHAPITVREIYAQGRSIRWPDYVFSPDYCLLPLSELEAYVRTYQHLPGLPSAKDVQQKGMPLTETHLALVRKVEELTLYVIALQKQVDSLRAQLQASPCK